MFATVEFYDGGNSFSKRLRHFLGREKIYTEKISLSSDECFYRLCVPVFDGKAQLRKLRNIDFALGEGLIFPSGVRVDTEGLRLYKTGGFPELVLMNTVVSALSQESCIGGGMCITVVDERAYLTNELHRLVPFASEIRVITKRPAKYTLTAEKLMKDYGISLVTGTDEREIPTEKGTVISFDAEKVPLGFKGTLFTAGERLLPFAANVFSARGIRAERKYLDLCPAEIDTMTFLSALYEAAFQKELHFTEFEKFVLTGVQKN